MNYTEETFGSARVAVSRWRPESRPSATVVAVHGFGVDGYRTYRYVADLLATAGIEVIAPDMPGFGKSGKMDRYSLSLYADIVAELARGIETPILGMGHSMGAKVILAAAIDHPAIFESYALINPGGFSVIGPWVVRQADKTAIVKLSSTSVVQGILRRTPLKFFTGDSTFTSLLKDFQGSHAHLDLQRSGYIDRLSEIRLPGLLIWGENDPLLPENVPEKVRRLIPTLTVSRIPDGGHAPMKGQPKLFVNQLLSFLKSREDHAT